MVIYKRIPHVLCGSLHLHCIALIFFSGKFDKVWNHEEAERLYCEEIDVGEETPRQIASGLREHVAREDMEGSLVLVVCNLKPAKLAGFVSNGMVLAAKGPDGKVKRAWIKLCG